MKFSYLNESSNGFGLPMVSRSLTGFISTIAPRFSAFIGKHLLLRPYGKRSYSDTYVTPVRELNLFTSMGKAHINLFGQGEQVIVVSHGWADSSQSFNKMIISLTEQGYLVAAIDHIGHGKSTGNKSHLLSFIETIELLIEHFNEERINIKGIVSHSMGAIATLNLPHYLLKDKKIILISSPINFFELMYKKVEQAGISRKLLKRALENISHKYGKKLHQLSSEHHRDKLALDLTFIHDRNDRFAPFTDIETFLQDEKPRLLATSGLGHTRILGDTNVIDNITQVLAT
jgi:pimeloyl-ACP methyl ester carboxylesterase